MKENSFRSRYATLQTHYLTNIIFSSSLGGIDIISFRSNQVIVIKTSKATTIMYLNDVDNAVEHKVAQSTDQISTSEDANENDCYFIY